MFFPRMRTINEAAAAFREIDPETAVTPYFIRQLVLNDLILYTKAGNRYLISLDALEDYLRNPQAENSPKERQIFPHDYGRLLRIEA